MRRIAISCLPVGLAVACAASADPFVDEPIADAGADAAREAEASAPPRDAGADADGDGAIPIDCAAVAFCPEPTALTALATLNAVWGSGPDDVWAVGTRGSILHREAGAFVVVDAGVNDLFFGVWGAGAASDPWILSSTVPYRYHRATHTLEPSFGADYTKNPFSTERLWALSGSSDLDVVLAGQTSSAFGGVSTSIWNLGEKSGELAWLPNPTVQGSDDQADFPTLRAVFSGGTFAWAVSDTGRSYRRALVVPDAGTDADASAQSTPTWRYVPTEASRTLESIWASGPDDVWTVGAFGTIQHFDASGAWHLVEAPTAVALHFVWGSGPTDVWAVGDEGVIVHFDGSAWRLVPVAFSSGVVPDLYGVWGSGPQDVYVVGSRGVLHRTSGSGSIQ